jgi:glycosyltransferase involved in cell wall biosynthesis
LIIGEGDAKDDVVALADSLGVRGDTVRFLPYQPKGDLPHSLTAGDVSVVTVEEGLEGVCVSSKLYTTMAAGTPVLAITHPTGDEARVIEACDAGVHVPQGDVDGVVDAVEAWRDDPDRLERQGENARAAFEEWFTRERAVDRYYALLTEGSAPETVMDLAAAQSEG